MDINEPFDFQSIQKSEMNLCGFLTVLLSVSAGCSHDRAISYFTSSITGNKKMTGNKCKTWSQFSQGECVNLPEALMGEHSDQK
jgi:hypothetical protein